MVLYSYAAHLRKSTYHQLPLTERAHANRERIAASRAPVAPVVVVDSVQDELAAAEAEINASDDAGPSVSSPPRRTPSPRRPAGSPGPGAAANGRPGKAKIETVDDENFSWD